jgi:Ca-activated chloride channel family protein
MTAHFAWPAGLPLLLLVPVAFVLLLMADRARRRRVEHVVGPRVRAHAAELGIRRRRLRPALFAVAALLALFAVLQPVWGTASDATTRRGVDIVVCLDVSRSMLARDVEPDRLAFAKARIRALSERAAGDRMALVLFAGEATLAVPLTRDLPSFADLADMASPLSVPLGGTDLGAALKTALGALEGRTGQHEAVVLMTDGDDPDARGLRLAETARDRGITVHCVGLGSLRGAKIPVEGAAGETFLKDRAGREVVTAMDGDRLSRIALTAGGTYVTAGDGAAPLLDLYEDRILPMARMTLGDGDRRDRENRFQWFLLAAFLLWITDLGLSERRR